MISAHQEPPANTLEYPRKLPDLNIPFATGTVDVRIINTTAYQRIRTESIYGQAVPGHEILNLPSYAFLITNTSSGTNVLFDLGMRKDWQKSCPESVKTLISDKGDEAPLQITIEKDITEILDADFGRLGINHEDIAAVIWSQHTFDHRGDITKFPSYTRLIVGPGTRHKHLHTDIDSKELEGREVIELGDKELNLEIGGFAAHDAFGDGSFYIMSCPGHTSSHLCALARVTAEPTPSFIFLGGDCAYHCAEFRPSPYAPLPKQVVFRPTTWAFDDTGKAAAAPVMRTRKIMLCSGEFVTDTLHPQKSASEPFYDTPFEPVVASHKDANESLAKMELFDASEDVLVCISHDPALMNVLPFYPYSLNDWQRKGYKAKLHWEFLYDFNLDEKPLSEQKKALPEAKKT